MPAGVLTLADRDILIAYAESTDLRLVAMGHVTREGAVMADRSGRPVPNPWVRVARDALADQRLLADRLGLTPAARAGLVIEGERGVRDGIYETIGLPPRLGLLAAKRAAGDDA
jgi:P27 family predicted phage terminase small subunit